MIADVIFVEDAGAGAGAGAGVGVGAGAGDGADEGSGRRCALLRSCPPSRASGSRLLLYFAPQNAPSPRSCTEGLSLSLSLVRPGSAGSVGWEAQRSKGGEPVRSLSLIHISEP